jgi:hypothetical protein
MRNDLRQETRPVSLIRLKNLLWVPLLMGAVALPELYGTPHMLTSYTYRSTQGARVYLRCDYWGLHPFTLHPVGGECPLFLFARAGRSR